MAKKINSMDILLGMSEQLKKTVNQELDKILTPEIMAQMSPEQLAEIEKARKGVDLSNFK